MLRDTYMRALRDNLVLRFDENRPIIRNSNQTPQEIEEANVREEDAYQMMTDGRQGYFTC